MEPCRPAWPHVLDAIEALERAGLIVDSGKRMNKVEFAHESDKTCSCYAN